MPAASMSRRRTVSAVVMLARRCIWRANKATKGRPVESERPLIRAALVLDFDALTDLQTHHGPVLRLVCGFTTVSRGVVLARARRSIAGRFRRAAEVIPQAESKSFHRWNHSASMPANVAKLRGRGVRVSATLLPRVEVSQRIFHLMMFKAGLSPSGSHHVPATTAELGHRWPQTCTQFQGPQVYGVT